MTDERRWWVIGYKPWKRQRQGDDGMMLSALITMLLAIGLFVLIGWSEIARFAG